MATDRRIVRTRKALSEAIISLTLTSGYENVLVKDITRYADVGYATFYRHFKSKDELLRYALKYALERLQEAVEPMDNLYDEAVAMYNDVRKRRSFYQVYLQLSHDNEIRQEILQDVVELFLRRYKSHDGSCIPMEVAVNHVIASAGELMRWYLDHMEEYSPEQVAAIHCELVLNSVISVAVEPREEWLRRYPDYHRRLQKDSPESAAGSTM